MLQKEGKGPTPPSSATTTPNITLSNLQKALILAASLGALAFAFHWTRTDSPDQTTEGTNSPNPNQSGTGNAQSQQTGEGDKQSQQPTGTNSPNIRRDQKKNSGSGTFIDNSCNIETLIKLPHTLSEAEKKVDDIVEISLLKKQIIKTTIPDKKYELCKNLLYLLYTHSFRKTSEFNIDYIIELKTDLDFLLRHGKGELPQLTRHLLLQLYFTIMILSDNNEIEFEDVLKSLKLDNKISFCKNVIDLSDTILQKWENKIFTPYNKVFVFLYRGIAKQSMDLPDEAIKDYLDAISCDRYFWLLHQQLSYTYSKIDGKADDYAKHKRIAEGLKSIDSSDFKDLPEEDKKFIYDYLEKEGPIFESKELDMNHVLEKDHGVAFGKVINYNPTITSLRLIGCHLNDTGVESIAKSLETNQSIEELRLGWNSLLTGKGVFALANSLQTNTNSKIKIISLVDCPNIDSEAFIFLIKCVPNGTIIELSLNDNIKRRQEDIEETANQSGVHLKFH